MNAQNAMTVGKALVGMQCFAWMRPQAKAVCSTLVVIYLLYAGFQVPLNVILKFMVRLPYSVALTRTQPATTMARPPLHRTCMIALLQKRGAGGLVRTGTLNRRLLASLARSRATCVTVHTRPRARFRATRSVAHEHQSCPPPRVATPPRSPRPPRRRVFVVVPARRSAAAPGAGRHARRHALV